MIRTLASEHSDVLFGESLFCQGQHTQGRSMNLKVQIKWMDSFGAQLLIPHVFNLKVPLSHFNIPRIGWHFTIMISCVSIILNNPQNYCTSPNIWYLVVYLVVRKRKISFTKFVTIGGLAIFTKETYAKWSNQVTGNFAS